MSTEKSSMCAHEINKFLHFKLGNEREELIAGIIDDYFPKRNRSNATEIASMEVILGKDSLNCTDMLLLRQLVQDAKRKEINSLEETYNCHWCGGAHDLTSDIRILVQDGKCSVSLLQRRCRYGFAHALEVCRQLEERGYLRAVHSGWELTEKANLFQNVTKSDSAAGVSSPTPPSSLTPLVSVKEATQDEE